MPPVRKQLYIGKALSYL